MGLDCTIVCAALLHDVLEDTDCDPGLLRAEFGEEVVQLVEQHTALRDGAAVPDDDRVITLKLLDRLHNMRTIEYLDTGKQLSRSRQTLELFVPQARRLRLPLVADELQELARHRIEVLAGEGGGEMTATLCALRLGSFLLPAAARLRYLEEWAAELRTPADRRSRRRFAWQLISGLPRLSLMLHRRQWDNRYTQIVPRAAASRLASSGRKGAPLGPRVGGPAVGTTGTADRVDSDADSPGKRGQRRSHRDHPATGARRSRQMAPRPSRHYAPSR